MKKFEKPEVEIISFRAQDIITASSIPGCPGYTTQVCEGTTVTCDWLK